MTFSHRLDSMLRQHGLFLASVSYCLFLLFTGFDQFWLAADDGYYAHTTERFLNGEIPHRDFHDIHPGYVLWLHAGAMALLGVDLLSLRMPLLALSIIQIILVWQLLRQSGRLPAALGMVLVTSLGLPGCANPTANLYALFFAIASFRVAAGKDLLERPARLVLLGFLVGLCILFRHLSGIFLGCGFAVWLLGHPRLQTQAKLPQSAYWPSTGKLLMVLLIVVGYSINRSDLFGLLLFAFPAILITLAALVKFRPEPKLVLRIYLLCGVGAVAAFLPLALYLSINGIWQAWFYDVVILPILLIDLPFIGQWYSSGLLISIGSAVVEIIDSLSALQFLTWIFFVAMPGIISWLVFRSFMVAGSKKEKPLPAFVVCAPFYGLAALHFEIPLYLMWSFPPLLLAGLLLVSQSKKFKQAGLLCFGIFAFGAQTAVVGAPVWERTYEQLVSSSSADFVAKATINERASVKLIEDEVDFYRRALKLIDQHVSPNETLFSFPSHPEWYFLSGRKNPTQHLFAGISLHSDESLASLKYKLVKNPPKMVIHKPKDKYENLFTARLRKWFNDRYQLIHAKNGFEFLVLKEDSPKN